MTYADSINQTLHQILDTIPESVLIGQGVTSPWYVGSTTTGLIDTFGSDRVIDTPVSESAVTGSAAGMALAGMRPIVMHPRMDFMLLAMDPIVNQIANWREMFGGERGMPLVMWVIVNRGGEQGAQHSQALHAMLAHVPGLKVVAPSSPANMAGVLYSAVLDEDPVVIIDDRWLYSMVGDVDLNLFRWPIGQAEVLRRGVDVTIIASSWLTLMADHAIHKSGRVLELIDLVSLSPLDEKTILNSVARTRNALILDGGWRSCGFAAEVAAVIAESDYDVTVRRLTLPDLPAPAARSLEKKYYHSIDSILEAVTWFEV